jgi:hypothetical protein
MALHEWTHGIAWHVPEGTPMVAAARGKVTNVENLGWIGKRLGGLMVTVAHGWFNSYYAHVEKVPRFPVSRRVERGDVIGLAGYRKNDAELMLSEAGMWVNPDNYGMNHGPMDYWDDKTDLEISKIEERRHRQKELFERFYSLCTGKDISELRLQSHKGMKWSTVERFRYLEHLYTQHPYYFSDTREGIDGIIREFYDNQPIILTFPFKKQ